VSSQEQSQTIVHSIPAQELAVTEQGWTFSNSEQANLLTWNGCPVVAAGDGRVIGILVATEQGTAIALMQEL